MNPEFLNILSFIGSIFTAYMIYRTAAVPRGETREQSHEREAAAKVSAANAESIEVATLETIIEQLRLRIGELETQNEKWKSDYAALEAVQIKRAIDESAARERLRRELVSYQAAYAQAVRILQKNNLTVPEVNGKDTPPGNFPAVKP